MSYSLMNFLPLGPKYKSYTYYPSPRLRETRAPASSLWAGGAGVVWTHCRNDKNQGWLLCAVLFVHMNVCECMYVGASSGFALFLCGHKEMFLLSFHNWSAGLVGRPANMRAEQKFPLRTNQNVNLCSASLLSLSKCVNACLNWQKCASKHLVQTVCGQRREGTNVSLSACAGMLWSSSSPPDYKKKESSCLGLG